MTSPKFTRSLDPAWPEVVAPSNEHVNGNQDTNGRWFFAFGVREDHVARHGQSQHLPVKRRLISLPQLLSPKLRICPLRSEYVQLSLRLRESFRGKGSGQFVLKAL